MAKSVTSPVKVALVAVKAEAVELPVAQPVSGPFVKVPIAVVIPLATAAVFAVEAVAPSAKLLKAVATCVAEAPELPAVKVNPANVIVCPLVSGGKVIFEALLY
jgi:hypothetical protein